MGMKKLHLMIIAWISFVMFVRIIFTLRSGFILPDEALYLYLRNGIVMGDRVIFQLFYAGIGKIFFFVDSLSYLIVLFYSLNCLWLIGIIFVLEKILVHMGVKGHVLYIMLIVPLSTITWVISNFTFLTEPMSLFFIVLGVYIVVKNFKDTKYVFLAGMCFAIASNTRMPYAVFFFNVIFLFFSHQRMRKRILNICIFLIPIVLFVDVPVGFGDTHVCLLSSTMSDHYDFCGVSSLVSLGTHVSRHVSFFQRIAVSFRNSFLSFVVGWNICFFVLLFPSVFLWKSRTSEKERKIFINGLIAVFLIVLMNFIIGDMYQNLNQNFSSFVRYSHMSLFGLVLLTPFFDRMSKKKMICVFVISIILLCITASLFIIPLQSNLSEEKFNRLSFEYKSNSFKVYEYLRDVEEDVVLFGDPLATLRLYLDELGVEYHLANELDPHMLDDFLENHRVFLYGELWEYHIELTRKYAPFFYDVISNRSDYDIDILWWTNDGYFIEVRKK